MQRRPKAKVHTSLSSSYLTVYVCALLVPKQKPKPTAVHVEISAVMDSVKANDGVAMMDADPHQAVAVTESGSSSVGDKDKQGDSVCGSAAADATSDQLLPPVKGTSDQLPPPVKGTSVVHQEVAHQVELSWSP